ncbi:hypothetical protein HDV64DRAFT_37492 [Trichoderma sp. TUCIM 5745]
MLPERPLGACDWRLSNYAQLVWALVLLWLGRWLILYFPAGLAEILAWRKALGPTRTQWSTWRDRWPCEKRMVFSPG